MSYFERKDNGSLGLQLFRPKMQREWTLLCGDWQVKKYICAESYCSHQSSCIYFILFIFVQNQITLFFFFFLPYIPIPRVHCLHVWIPDWKDQLLAFAWAFREELLGLTAWMNQNLGCLSLSLSFFLSLTQSA